MPAPQVCEIFVAERAERLPAFTDAFEKRDDFAVLARIVFAAPREALRLLRREFSLSKDSVFIF